jgi:copper chaperone
MFVYKGFQNLEFSQGEIMKKTEFSIKGMHCPSCTMLVKEALTDVKGVKDAKVDLKKNNAVVEYDDKLASEKQLIAAVKAEGYEATIAK